MTNNFPSSKITISVAGKFHALSLAKEYNQLKILENIYCINRNINAPKSISASTYHNRIDLAWLQQVGARLPINLFSTDSKNRAFDSWMAKKLPKSNPGVLHGWNGCSYETFKALKKTEWQLCVERSCPHNQIQYDLLSEEAENLSLNYHQDVEGLKRNIEELYLADTIICPSKYSARSYTDPELIKKLACVSLGSNYKYQDRQPKKNDKLSILSVGNNFLRKGTHYLIEAMKYIDDPNAELIIRGEVPTIYRDRIKDPRIKIVGPVSLNHLYEIYSNATVFVQPSIDEGFGMTVLEALSFGLPLVITENVGAGDVLNNWVAKTVPIRNAEALATAIKSAHTLPGITFDDERRKIINTYTWRRCASELADRAYNLSPI